MYTYTYIYTYMYSTLAGGRQLPCESGKPPHGAALVNIVII